MQIPLQITLRNLAKSAAVEAEIRKRADKLDRFHPEIVSCRVVVELPSRHKQQGKDFVVRLDIKVPGSEIVINHDHNEDLYVALHEAFHAAQRRHPAGLVAMEAVRQFEELAVMLPARDGLAHLGVHLLHHRDHGLVLPGDRDGRCVLATT